MNSWRKSRIKSFKFAFAGLKLLLSEPNFVVQSVLGIAVFILAALLKINSVEWLILVIVVGLVLFAEAVNTAIEEISDAITLEEDPRIKRIKDISAAAVLITAISSVIAGVIIFLPYIINLIKG